MSYPNSSDVASGQPTASAHYNNLRKDAVYMGNVSADSVNLGAFLQAFVLNLHLEYLATNRLRIAFDSQKPACVMISGCMLVQTSDIDLASSSFSGAAATWYVFANRAAGVTSFTLTVNTSAVPAADQRLIGEVYWDGTVLAAASVFTYSEGGDFLAPDYDSNWFAVANSTLYTKAHGLGQRPRFIALYWADPAALYADWYLVSVVITSGVSVSVAYFDQTNVYCRTGGSATEGTLKHSVKTSGGGVYRVFAWV